MIEKSLVRLPRAGGWGAVRTTKSTQPSVDLIAPRSGVEPATFRSRVQRPTTAPRRQPNVALYLVILHTRGICRSPFNPQKLKHRLHQQCLLPLQFTRFYTHLAAFFLINFTKPFAAKMLRTFLRMNKKKKRSMQMIIGLKLAYAGLVSEITDLFISISV